MPGVLLVGNGARDHAIAEAIMRSRLNPKLFSCMKTNNPGIAALSSKSLVGPYEDLAAIMAFMAVHVIMRGVFGLAPRRVVAPCLVEAARLAQVLGAQRL